jgi:putative ABC transport system substrate-binding protein
MALGTSALLVLLCAATLPGAPAPQHPGAAISGTITLDPSAKDALPKDPLLMIIASNSPDPKKPPMIVKRIPGAVFPYAYTLTEEDITLVGSTFGGSLFISARVVPGGVSGTNGAGVLQGRYTGNPVSVGSTNVEIAIARPTGVPTAETPAPPHDRPGTRILRVGLLWSGSTPFDPWSVPESLRKAFSELGYEDGQNMTFEPRYAEGRYDRLPQLAAELVGAKVDVILAAGDSASVRAAKDATKTTPIVMMAFADAVQLGLVASLPHPGGNITGLSFPLAGIFGKQLEFLKKALSNLSRVAVLWNPANPGHPPVMWEIHGAAKLLGIRLQPLDVRGPEDFERAFSAIKRGRAQALLALWDPMLYAHGGQLTLAALRNRLPTISTHRGFVEAAGLMAYGPRLPDIFRGGAAYVDKLVRGAKPAELPVEKPTRLELVVNLATAKALGITLPQAILVRADKIVQ